MTESLAVQLDDLEKVVDGEFILNKIDLSIELGENYCLVGPNGAGKTTLFDILMNFQSRSAGEVRVLGVNPEKDPLDVYSQTSIVAEGFEVCKRLTGYEHVRYAAKSYQSALDPSELLDEVGLTTVAQDRAATYSKGMKKRLSLAMALVSDPTLLILDEPFSGLDPEGRSILHSILRGKLYRNSTVLLSSHNLQEVESLADRIGVLRDGELIANGEITQIRDDSGSDASILPEPYQNVFSDGGTDE